MSKNIWILALVLGIIILSNSKVVHSKRIIVAEGYYKNVILQDKLFRLSSSSAKCYFGYCFLSFPDKSAEKLLSDGFAIEDRPIFKINRLDGLSLTSVYKLWNESFLDINLTGSGIKVAIIDTGINVQHQDVNYTFADIENWKYCYNAILGKNATAYGNLSVCNDTDGHGTFVAGIIAGRYQGNITKCFEGYECGVAPNVTVMAIKIFSGEYAYLSDIMDGINYAVENGADIISMSFGTDINISCYDPEVSILTNTIDEITKNGIVTVASAGNGLYINGSFYVNRTVFPPACSKNVIAVGSTNKNGEISYFSSRGPTDDNRVKPDLVAPGENIHSTTLSGYGYGSGTSFSAPFVSGIVALMKEYAEKRGISLNTEEIKAILLTSANPYGNRDNIYGSGMVNATRAIEILNKTNYFDVIVSNEHPLAYKVNITNKPFKVVIYANSNSTESFVLDAKMILGNHTIYSNAYNTSDNVNEILYNESGTGWLYLRLLTNASKKFTLAYTGGIEKVPYEFIYIKSPTKTKYLATESINISVYVGDIDGNPYNKSINMTIYYPNNTLETIQLNYTNGSCNYILYPHHQGNYTFEFFSLYPDVKIDPKNITIEVKSYLFNVTSPNSNQIYLIGDVLYSSIYVLNATGDMLNSSVLTVNASLLNSSFDRVMNITYFLNSSSNNSAVFVTNLTLGVNPDKYYINAFLYVNNSLVDEMITPIVVTNNYIINVTTNVTNDSVYYPDTTVSFEIEVFHPNGTKINITNINKSVYFVNSSLSVFNNIINQSNGTMTLNSSIPGDYYLFFNVSDQYGNYQNKSLYLHLSYYVRNVSVSVDRLNYTLDSVITISINAFENQTNMSAYMADINVTFDYTNGCISNLSVTDSSGAAVVYITVPEDVPNRTYNLTVSVKDKFGNLVEKNVSVDILRYFPIIRVKKSINTTENITVNVTVLDYKLDPVSATVIITLESILPNGQVMINNSDPLVGNDVQATFKPYLNEPLTYEISVVAVDGLLSTNYKGVNSTKVYSGVVIRPTSNLELTGCKPPSLATNKTKDYCVFDSNGQHDLKINPNEKMTFSALLYYGSTVENDNYPTNVTYYVNVSNATNNQLLFNLTGNLTTNNVTIEIPPLNSTGLYNVKVKIHEYNPGEVLENEFNVSVETLNVTILQPNQTYVYDVDNSISVYGTVEKNGTRIGNANITISSNTTDFGYSCLNANTTNSSGEFDCSLKFNKLGDYVVNVSAKDEYGIEGCDTKNVEIKDLSIETSISPSTIYNGTEVTVTANIKILPDDSWIDGGTVKFTFYGECNNNDNTVYTVTKSTGYSFSQKFTPQKSGTCYVDISANTKDSRLSEEKTISFEVKEKSQPPSTGGVTADLEITDYTQKLYIEPGKSNYTLVEVLAYNTNIIQNVSLYVISIPASWYTITPSSKLIDPDKTGVFNVTFSIPEDASAGEYTGYFKANSSYASDTKAFKIVILAKEKNETVNITATAEVFYNTYKEKLNVWNSTILSLKNESYNTTEIEALYNEIRELLDELKKSIDTNNVTAMEAIMTKIKQKEIEIATAFQKVQPIEHEEKKSGGKIKTLGIIFGAIVLAVLVYLFWPYENKAKYDYKKGKFTWKPPKEKSEIDKLWEKIKEKIQKLAS